MLIWEKVHVYRMYIHISFAMFYCALAYISIDSSLISRTLISQSTLFYFISSSEFNTYLNQIKVILSAVKKISYYFTSDE